MVILGRGDRLTTLTHIPDVTFAMFYYTLKIKLPACSSGPESRRLFYDRFTAKYFVIILSAISRKIGKMYIKLIDLIFLSSNH